MKQRPSMEKRRKEQARKDRQQSKIERRERRKAEREQRDPNAPPDNFEAPAAIPNPGDTEAAAPPKKLTVG
jgi:hypothetical protein